MRADYRLEVRLFYHGNLVQKLVTTSPDGCFILHGCAPVGSERIYGPCEAKKVFFPHPDIAHLPPGISEAMTRLLPHLEKGVLVWVAPDGVFIKRFCQGRVYWDGPLQRAPTETPTNWRERGTCKLLDMTIFVQGEPGETSAFLHFGDSSVLTLFAVFLAELQNHRQGTGPEPQYTVDLCFGEEFPDPSQPKTQKLITAQVSVQCTLKNAGLNTTQRWVQYGQTQQMACFDPAIGLNV